MTTSNPESGPWTVSRLLAWTQEHFAHHGVDSPRLCAELLLAHAMECTRIHLYTRHDSVPDENILQRFRASLLQAVTGRPIAYLTGKKEFFSLVFEVTPDVLIPRPETEILVERTIDLVRHSKGTLSSVLDLGTGSGCIAVSLAKHLPGVTITASDVSEPALAIARRNAERHEVAELITFVLGDLFVPWPATDPQFDIIVCNPPYVATAPDTPVDENVRRFEPHLALFAGPEGLDIIHRIVNEAPARLKPGGHLLLEIGFDQSRKLHDLLDNTDWQDVTAYCDGAGHERAIHARHHAADKVQIV